MKLLCSKCGVEIDTAEQTTFWDYKGSGYDTELTICPECGQLNIVRYYEEPDRTAWYYEYRRRISERYF